MNNIQKSKNLAGNEINAFTNCNLSRTSTEGRLISINEKYLAMAWKSKGELNIVKSNNIPVNLSTNSSISLIEKSNILDIEFSPFENNILSFGNENKSVYIIKIKEENKKIILDSSMIYKKHKNKVNFIKFNPVASNIMCSSTLFREVHIWDSIKFETCIQLPECKYNPTSIHWSQDGNLIGISTKKEFLNIFDSRQKKYIFEKQFDELNGKLVFDWIDNNDIVAIGQNKKNQRIVGLFDIRNQKDKMKSYSCIVIDKENSAAIPFVDRELKLIYTVGKDKTPINIYDYSDSSLKKIYSYSVSQANQFSVFYPRKYLDKKNFEIDRIITSNKNINFISFKIPNEKNSGFSGILYPDEESGKPLMTYKEWIEGKRIDQINLNEVKDKKENLKNDINIITKELNLSKDKGNIIDKELKSGEVQKDDKNKEIKIQKIENNKNKIIAKEEIIEKNKEINNKEINEKIKLLEKTQNKISCLEKENSEIINELKKKSDEIIKLKKEVNNKEEEIKIKQNEINLLKKEKEDNDKLKKQQKDLNEKYNTTLKELNKNKNEIESLKKELELIKSEKIKGEKNICDLKEKFDSLLKKNEKEKNDYESMKKENELKDIRIKELLDKINNIEINNDLIKINENKISEMENNIQKKEDIINDYKKIIEENKIFINNKKAEIEKKNNLIYNLENQIDELNNNQKKIEEESEKYKNEINNKNKEIDEIRKQLLELKEENELNNKLRENNKKLEEKINEININNEKEYQINEELSKEIENYKNNKIELELKLKELKEEEEKFIEKINNYEQIIKKNNQEFNDKIDILEKENREKLSELERQNQELKTKYDNIIIEKDNEIQFKENKIKNLENDVKCKNELVEKNEIIITKLKDELNQLNDELSKEKEEIKQINLKMNAISISEIKKEKEIESIKELYENKFKEELKKIGGSLHKEMEEKLGIFEKEYNDKFKLKEEKYDFKFNKINKEIQNYLKDFQDESESEKENEEQKKDDIVEYSYECLNKNDLVLDVNEGNNVAILEIALKNNGDKEWHKDSKLQLVKPSDLNIDDKILNRQIPTESKTYLLKIYNLGNYAIGEYKSYLEFYSDGKKYGEKIEIKINIRENHEIKKYIDKINEFKKEYNLNDKDFSNEKVLEALKNNDFDYIKTFSSMFN